MRETLETWDTHTDLPLTRSDGVDGFARLSAVTGNVEQVGLGRELSCMGKASHALRNSGVGVAKYKWIKVQEIIRTWMRMNHVGRIWRIFGIMECCLSGLLYQLLFN